MERSNELRILTNDPSFTAWGWAIVDGNGRVFKSGCIKTENESKKKRIRVSDDRTRRTEEITDYLLMLIEKHNITYILSEAPHGSQNAAAAVMIGIVIGVLVGITKSRNIPIEWYNEQDAKKCLLGKKAATKADIIEGIDRLYEVDWTDTKYIDEAVADALAIYHVATKQSQVLKYMKS